MKRISTVNSSNHISNRFTFSSTSFKQVNFICLAGNLIEKVRQLLIGDHSTPSTLKELQQSSSVDSSFHHSEIGTKNNIISEVTSKEKTPLIKLNYQLNIQQMNLFTYLKRAITSSEQSLKGKFLKQFKSFLSVIVGAASDINASLEPSSRVFGVLSTLGDNTIRKSKSNRIRLMYSSIALVCLTLFTAFKTVAGLPDLSVTTVINTQSPTLGQEIIYTIKLKNANPDKATGVELTDLLPAGLVYNSALVTAGSTTTSAIVTGGTKLIWAVGEVAGNSELTLTIKGTANTRGLFFNIAEVTKENEGESNSIANNNDLQEDDQDAVCYAIADYFYKGEEATSNLPVGYTNVVWTKKVGVNGTPQTITNSTPGVTLLADGNIRISAVDDYTEYAFVATNKTCPTGGCCPIKYIPGPLGSIGDYVWRDNGDGIQGATATEPGVAGVKVILYKADGVTKIDSTTTDVNGKYLFDSLLTDQYKVKFILPTGSTFSPKGATTDDKDSDVLADGFSGLISIDVEKTGKDKDNTDVDAGLIGNVGSIGDFVFRDDNQNGIQDSGEPGLANIKVNLYKGAVFASSATTDGSGKYNFPNLDSGSYTVEVESPLQSKFTKRYQGTDHGLDSDVGTDGKSGVITIDITKATTDTLRNNPRIDAGIVLLGSIGDYVFNDNNGDGIQNGGDTPLANVKVTLTDGSGNIITTATTDATGKYEFIVPSGQYIVVFDKPVGTEFSPKGAGTATDSDAGTDGKTSVIIIDTTKPIGDPARNNNDIDAGLIPNKGTIGDYVFIDNNSNNKQDAGDTPLANVTVELYDNAGTVKLKTAVTGVDGKYLFTDLASGNYKVKFVLPTGKTFVTPNVGTSTEDSDAGTGGFSATIAIDVTKPVGDIGRNNLTIDAGVKGDCTAGAGTLATTNPNFCLPQTAGSAILTATTATSPVVPAGYSVKYLLSSGSNFVIQQIANAPTFTVSAAGSYTIHTLVFDGSSSSSNYLNISNIVLGTTKTTDVTALVTSNNLCAALDLTGVKFNVNTTPSGPQIAGATICAGSSAVLGTAGLSDPVFNWYTSNTSTTPFATTSSINVTPTGTVTYYVSTIGNTPNACESNKTAVVVTVNPIPTKPAVNATLANNCNGSNTTTVNLATALLGTPSTTGGVFEWHTTNSATSAVLTSTTAVGAGTYYVFEKSTSTCYSLGSSVTVNINDCQCANPAGVTLTPLAAVCGSTTTPVQLNATLTGGATNGTWTSNGTGTFDNANSLTAKYTSSATDITKGSVEFTFTTNDPDGAGTLCNAANAKTILVITAKPATPYNLKCDTLICLGNSNKLFAVSVGNSVKWYETLTSTTSIGVGSDLGFIVTPNAEGTFTYYAEATSQDGCVSDRSSISFKVKRCFTDLAVTKTVSDLPDAQSSPSYLLGQEIVYSINAENLGVVKSTDVKVTDVLPAGLIYVSSTPAGYDNTTGIWTIGDLPVASNKVLNIRVKLAKTGSIVNSGEITGTNEDVTKKGNNKSTVTINVIDIADLSLTKTVSTVTPNVGDTLTYTLTALNAGPNTATNVEVKDVLPAGLTFIASSTLTNASGTLKGVASSILKGASATFTFTAKVTASGKTINAAEISKSDQKDSDSTPGNGTDKNEDDDDSVEINATKSCNIVAPIIACGKYTICAGESIAITSNGCANGSVMVWSNGEVGTTSITVSPAVNQTYVAYCKDGECKSLSSNPITLTVIKVDAPLLSSSPSKVCTGEEVTLTASGCDGVVEWQTSPIQTGPSITVRPTVSQSYKALCKEFTCTSPLASVDVIVVPKPLAPVVVCEKPDLCPGESMTLTAINCNGQVKWSNGKETTSIVVSPTSTTDYTVTCTVNGCTSAPSSTYTITVKPVEVPVIKVKDLILCAGESTTLTAEGCTGKVTWFFGVQSLTGATINVKPATTTTYYATCSSVFCTSEKSIPVTVTVANPSSPIISAGNSTICEGSTVELRATGCEGTVKWSDGQTGATITIKPEVSTAYTATCVVGTCVSGESNRQNITVTEFAKPTITANTLTVCAGQPITLTANGCNGTVKWSDGITGSPRTITPTANINYTATCESPTCKSGVSNELAIKVTPSGTAPVITAGINEICEGESVTLTATGCTDGSVKWSDGKTGASITTKPSVTTTYTAICINSNGCSSVNSNEKTITVKPAKVLNLVASSSNASVCTGTEVTLTLTGCSEGVVNWTGGLTGASIKVTPTATTTYTATCTGFVCATGTTANVKVTVLPGASTPTITANTTQICAGTEAVLTVNNCNGAIVWSTGATTSSITVRPTANTIYTVQCKVEGCGEAKVSEPVIIKVGTPEAPTVSSTPTSVCAGGQVTLTATGCGSSTVLWSNGKIGDTIIETVNSTTTYSAVCKQGTCNSPQSNQVTVTTIVPAVPTISCETNIICAGSKVTLIASGCEGTVNWSDGQSGVVINASPSVTTAYTATCTIGNCKSLPSGVATVNVGSPTPPTIVCNATSICQGIEITLTASNCSGTVVWNDGQVGSVITAKPLTNTSYTAVCKLDRCESAKSKVITISVAPGIQTPKTKDLVNVCPFKTVDLASGVTTALSTTGGTFEYHVGIAPTSALVTSPNTVKTGTYYVFEKGGSGCYSNPGIINVYINEDCTPKDCAKTPAIASAGDDATICAEKIYKLNGTFGGAATYVTWTTTGTGTFDNPLLPNATYRSSLADVLAGTVKLIITTNDPDGSGICKIAKDTMTLTMQGVKFKPLVEVTGSLNACSTDSVTLTATAGYQYKWFKVGSTESFASTRSVKVGTSGSYYFKLVDVNKCCSIESDTALVKLIPVLNAPLASSVKIDKGTTTDITKLVSTTTPTGATLVFKTGAASTSTNIANPSAVGAGTYYACYRSAQGCYSLPAKIVVEYKGDDSGGTTNKNADVVITVSTENNIAIDSTVKVTITVKNNGPATAKNVTVTSPVSTGLKFVSQTGGLILTGTNLNGTVDSLISGETKVYTWIGKVTGALPIIVTGTGTSTTPDPNPNNNNGNNPNGSVTIIAPSPNSSDLVVTITTDKLYYAKGDTVTTTITVRNLGPATAKNIVVVSEIPGSLTYVSQTGGLIKTGSNLTGKLDSLVKNGVKIYIYKSVLTGTGAVTIVGGGTSSNPDPNPNNNNGTGSNGSVTINPGGSQTNADVVISITTDKVNYAKGDTATVTITVRNLGPATAKGISVNTSIPGTFTYINQTGGLVKTGNLLTGTIDSLVRDGVKIYTYKAVINSNGQTTIGAGGTSTTTDPNPNNNNGSGTNGTVVINPGVVDNTLADVAITITADKASAKVDDSINFLVTVTNNGPATAKTVVITNPIPVGLTFVSSSTGQVVTGGLITINIDSLVKGQVKTYAYVAKMKVKTNVTNSVAVVSPKDPNATNDNGFVTINANTDSTITTGNADLAIIISADKQLIANNDEVTFTLSIKNNGPVVATGVLVDNILPKYLTFVSGDPSKIGDTLRTSVASIPVGTVATFTYKAKVTKDTIIHNTAKIAKLSQTDPVLTNNVSTVVLVPASDTTYADLGVILTASKANVVVDENVTYTVTLTNNGAGNAKNVSLCNVLPAGLTFVSSTDFTKSGDTLKVKADTISKGKTRTYAYIAKATKTGEIANTLNICNSSKPDLITPNNTSTATINVTGSIALDSCRLGLAMAVIDTAKVSDGVYNVTYRLIAKNFCKDTLTNVTLTSNIANTFKTPVTCEIVGTPNVGSSSKLIVNNLFSKLDSNLVNTGSILLPGAVDTLKYVVKITLNGNKGPFYSQSEVKGKKPSGDILSAKSSDGTDVNGTPSRTVLRFDLPNTRIGLAKEVVVASLKQDSTNFWTVPYRIRVVNMGANAITKLSVKDSLDAVFAVKGALVIGKPLVIATPGLVINPNYTGSGVNSELLIDSLSTLPKGETGIIDLTVRVNVKNATDEVFSNVAIGFGTGTDKAVYKDLSTAGTNPDKNGDKDPSNDFEATSVRLTKSSNNGPSIGLALAAVTDTVPQADSTYNVTFLMVAKNYGTVNLSSVRLCNNIETMLGRQVGAWTIVGIPTLLKGTATLNTTFNGNADSTLTVAASSTLAVGDSIVIAYIVNIKNPSADTIYNQAIVKAVSVLDATAEISDKSEKGANPDTNGDGNPNEAAPTPIIFPTAAVVAGELFVPQGFSPNGDNVNDQFVVKGLNKTTERLEIQIYNRWNGLVYASEDYDNTWDGKSNQGIKAIGEGQGLPSGTYFYSIILKDRTTGEKKPLPANVPAVRYITISR